MSATIECPSCGGPAKQLPADPRAPIRCAWCGASYQRENAEATVRALKADITDWLRKTTGVASAEGAGAVDATTRTFLFNDRILPGLRRDVRRALDEQIGDVDGAPVVVPPLLHHLQGFRADDALLVTHRDAVMSLRGLRARLEADDVAAFATTAADKIALQALHRDIDRTLLLSNAACALASGIGAGATLALTNLEAIAGEMSTLESTADPENATLARGTKLRAEALSATVRALGRAPADTASLSASAARLEETAQWLLTTETRSLRTALASTGIQRDATAVRTLSVIAESVQNTPLAPLKALDALAHLSTLLGGVTRPRDATALVNAWARALVAKTHGGELHAATDTSWVNGAIAQAAGQVAPSRVDVLLAPFWLATVRHTQAEGFFFVSGKQKDGLVLIPASASYEGTQLIPRDAPLAGYIHQATQTKVRVALPIEPPCVGPETARLGAKAFLRTRDMKNITLGDATLVYVPIALAQVGSRGFAVSPMGVVPHDPSHVMARVTALDAAARAAS